MWWQEKIINVIIIRDETDINQALSVRVEVMPFPGKCDQLHRPVRFGKRGLPAGFHVCSERRNGR